MRQDPNKIRYEKGNIKTDITEIQKIIRSYNNQLYAENWKMCKK
jgi:hypothetical protein